MSVSDSSSSSYLSTPSSPSQVEDGTLVEVPQVEDSSIEVGNETERAEDRGYRVNRLGKKILLAGDHPGKGMPQEYWRELIGWFGEDELRERYDRYEAVGKPETPYVIPPPQDRYVWLHETGEWVLKEPHYKQLITAARVAHPLLQDVDPAGEVRYYLSDEEVTVVYDKNTVDLVDGFLLAKTRGTFTVPRNHRFRKNKKGKDVEVWDRVLYQEPRKGAPSFTTNVQPVKPVKKKRARAPAAPAPAPDVELDSTRPRTRASARARALAPAGPPVHPRVQSLSRVPVSTGGPAAIAGLPPSAFTAGAPAPGPALPLAPPSSPAPVDQPAAGANWKTKRPANGKKRAASAPLKRQPPAKKRKTKKAQKEDEAAAAAGPELAEAGNQGKTSVPARAASSGPAYTTLTDATAQPAADTNGEIKPPAKGKKRAASEPPKREPPAKRRQTKKALQQQKEEETAAGTASGSGEGGEGENGAEASALAATTQTAVDNNAEAKPPAEGRKKNASAPAKKKPPAKKRQAKKGQLQEQAAAAAAGTAEGEGQGDGDPSAAAAAADGEVSAPPASPARTSSRPQRARKAPRKFD
ncbi:hypothetical protein AJ80_03985 [Polytolypa hystricis UAMH7299]|uniref:Uncharacterized protein n=1 Tax=Polytolypa hystricis (strain UAMH7299) TaxID=1447883 RepID=A0A2B7YDK4_POLH7|nr:hypothetical protein AJ80_03985 [Polytolypa hystricis UAMH7299]